MQRVAWPVRRRGEARRGERLRQHLAAEHAHRARPGAGGPENTPFSSVARSSNASSSAARHPALVHARSFVACGRGSPRGAAPEPGPRGISLAPVLRGSGRVRERLGCNVRWWLRAVLRRLARLGVAIAALAGPGCCDVYEPGQLVQQQPNRRDGAAATAAACAVPDGGSAGAGPSIANALAEPPRCTRAHARTACVEGSCLLVECEPPYVDCDGLSDNGCEATLDSTEHCGLCGCAPARCRARDGAASAAPASSRLRRRYGDCDESAGQRLRDVAASRSIGLRSPCGERLCGARPRARPAASAASAASAQCLGPVRRLRRRADNGCEEPLRSITHCGGCDSNVRADARRRRLRHRQLRDRRRAEATRSTATGVCPTAARPTLDSPEHCGACGAAASCRRHASARCAAREATPRCQVDHSCGRDADCETGAPTGCEPGFGDCNGLSATAARPASDSLSDCGGLRRPLPGRQRDQRAARTAAASSSAASRASTAAAAACAARSRNDADSLRRLRHRLQRRQAQLRRWPLHRGRAARTGRADCNATRPTAARRGSTASTTAASAGSPAAPSRTRSRGCTGTRCAIGDCDRRLRGLRRRGRATAARSTCARSTTAARCKRRLQRAVRRGELRRAAAASSWRCDTDRADCNDDLADGCETSTLLARQLRRAAATTAARCPTC